MGYMAVRSFATAPVCREPDFFTTRAPHLVFLTDRGKTLRFLRGGRVRLDANAMKDYIKAGQWKTLEPWSSAYAPGGER